MRVVLRSGGGDGASFAVQLAREGHEVIWAPVHPSELPMSRGLTERSTFTPSVRLTDLVFCDSLKLTHDARHYRRIGASVIGGNRLEDWEDQRDIGIGVAEQGGLKVAQSHSFSSVDQAVRFLEAEGGEWYFKPDGEVPKHLTGKDDADQLMRFLKWAKPNLHKVPRFVLQAPAPAGCEVDVSVWIDGHRVLAYEVDFEEKKFCTDNTGPALGCSSNLVWWTDRCKLTKLTIEPFVEHLLAAKYVGVAAINVILTPQLDVYFLEFTMRPGWDSTLATFACMEGNVGDQLAEFGRGALRKFNRRDEAGMTLRVSLPPLPSENADEAKRMTGLPLPEAVVDTPAFLPEDVEMAPHGPILATGSGYLGVAVTAGTNLAAMRKRLVETAKGLEVRDAMYRTDPVSRAEEGLAFLREHKLCDVPVEDK